MIEKACSRCQHREPPHGGLCGGCLTATGGFPLADVQSLRRAAELSELEDHRKKRAELAELREENTRLENRLKNAVEKNAKAIEALDTDIRSELRIGTDDRQQMQDRLSDAYAAGYLDEETFTARMDAAWQAQTKKELSRLGQDLARTPKPAKKRISPDRCPWPLLGVGMFLAGVFTVTDAISADWPGVGFMIGLMLAYVLLAAFKLAGKKRTG